MRIAIVGNFGLQLKATMASRALPMARELARLGHPTTVLLPADPAPAQLIQHLNDGTGHQLLPESPPDSKPGVICATEAIPNQDVDLHTELPDDLIHLISIGSTGSTSALARFWLGARITWRAVWLRPDVLFAFKPISYAGLTLFAFWILRRAGLLKSVLVLDTDDWEGEGGWIDREPVPWWQRKVVIWQERWCLRHADVVTAASRELVRLAKTVRSEVVYAPNAASPSSPGWSTAEGTNVRQAYGLGGLPVVLAYTRFVEFAPERLVEAFARIRERVPSARLLVVGKGLHGEEQAFRRAVRQRGLDEVVHHAGWVPPGAIPSYLAAADVALYLLDDTLLNRTKCPMKLVDLLLAGVPTVADAVGQAREYVVDGKTGYLVASGDPNAMAERAAALLSDVAERRRISQTARQYTLATWTWERQALTVSQAIQTALNTRDA